MRSIALGVVFTLAAGVNAAENLPELGDRPVSYSAVISWREVLRESNRYRDAEERRFVEEIAQLTRIETLKQELNTWQSFRSSLQDGAEDESAARALRGIIAGKQLEIEKAQALAKLDFERRARENLDAAIDDIRCEIERFASRHDISIVVSTEIELPEFRFADLSSLSCRRPRSRTFEEPKQATPAEARARFEEEVVFQQNIDITYDIVEQLNRPR